MGWTDYREQGNSRSVRDDGSEVVAIYSAPSTEYRRAFAHRPRYRTGSRDHAAPKVQYWEAIYRGRPLGIGASTRKEAKAYLDRYYPG